MKTRGHSEQRMPKPSQVEFDALSLLASSRGM